MNYFYDVLPIEVRNMIFGIGLVKIQRCWLAYYNKKRFVDEIFNSLYESIPPPPAREFIPRWNEPIPDFLDVCDMTNAKKFKYLSTIFKGRKITKNNQKWRDLLQEVWYSFEDEILCHPRQIEGYNICFEAFWHLLFSVYTRDEIVDMRYYFNITDLVSFNDGLHNYIYFNVSPLNCCRMTIY